ncbi:MAG: MutS protein msh4 [Chaenotheca gracillima]|nr:MAG: MutS protein msh4 [Chaenotheca gracillima]
MTSLSILLGLWLVGLVDGQCSGTTTIGTGAEATSLANCNIFDGDVEVTIDSGNSVSLNGISEITGDLSFEFGRDYKSLRADDLVTIGQTLSVRANDLLDSVDFPSLKNVDNLYLYGLPNLTTFNTDSPLTNVSSITIRGTKLSDLDWLQPKYVESLSIQRNPSLSRVSLPVVNSSSFVEFELNGPNMQLSLPDLEVAYNLSISNCEEISLPSLAYVNSSLGFYANSAKKLSIPRLLNVRNTVMLWNNSMISDLELPMLTNVSSNIIMHGNTALKTLDLPKLENVKGDIVINGSFTKILLPSLADVEGDVLVRSTTTLDCAPLDAYDDTDVFKARYHCDASAASASPSSSSGASDVPAPSDGLSGVAKGGVAAGVIIGALLLALGGLILFRRRKHNVAAVRHPDEESDFKGLDTSLLPSELPHEDRQELDPTTQERKLDPNPAIAEVGSHERKQEAHYSQAEIDGTSTTNAAQLSGGKHYDTAELEDVARPVSELPGGPIFEQHESLLPKSQVTEQDRRIEQLPAQLRVGRGPPA